MSNDTKALAELLRGSFYSGELSKGPPYPYRGLLDTPLAEGEAAKILRDEQERRLPELLHHFGIDPTAPDAWKELAVALAGRHVPGFQWDYASAVQRLATHGNLGFGLGLGWYADPNSTPPKRGRGRPRKVRYDGGLLGMKLPGRKGRPTLRSLDEKRELVEMFEKLKAKRQLKTDRETAEVVARHQLPNARSERVIKWAQSFASDIRTWRHELKKLKNASDIPA